jgi:hypothetical protein
MVSASGELASAVGIPFLNRSVVCALMINNNIHIMLFRTPSRKFVSEIEII